MPTLYPEQLSLDPCPHCFLQAAWHNSHLAEAMPFTKKTKNMALNEPHSTLDVNIVWPLTFPFASPITIGPKADRTYRLCTHYRHISEQMDLFPYPMLNADQVIRETGSCSILSCIDLQYQMCTALFMFFNLYDYNMLPFGQENSSAWFQMIMGKILQPFQNFCMVYIAVYRVCSKSHSEHLVKGLEALCYKE